MPFLTLPISIPTMFYRFYFQTVFQLCRHHRSLRFFHFVIYIATSYPCSTQVLSCHFCLEAFSGSLVFGVKFKLFNMGHKVFMIRPYFSSFIFNRSPKHRFLWLLLTQTWEVFIFISQIKKLKEYLTQVTEVVIRNPVWLQNPSNLTAKSKNHHHLLGGSKNVILWPLS